MGLKSFRSSTVLPLGTRTKNVAFRLLTNWLCSKNSLKKPITSSFTRSQQKGEHRLLEAVRRLWKETTRPSLISGSLTHLLPLNTDAPIGVPPPMRIGHSVKESCVSVPLFQPCFPGFLSPGDLFHIHQLLILLSSLFSLLSFFQGQSLFLLQVIPKRDPT